MVRITALEPQERHPERVNLFVDGSFRCGIALEIVYAAGLRVGASIPEATLAELERKDQLWKAREAALHLLSYRARSAAELRRRLLRKEVAPEIVEACVADLAERGLVDDAAFAAAFVRDRVRGRPRGARRLVQELRARGVGGETAARVVADTLENEAVSEFDLAREAAEGWARRLRSGRAGGGERLDPLTLRRRLHGFLARRGFGGEAIRAAMEAALGERAD